MTSKAAAVYWDLSAEISAGAASSRVVHEV